MNQPVGGDMGQDSRQAVRDVLALARTHRSGLGAAAHALRGIDQQAESAPAGPAHPPSPAPHIAAIDRLLEDWRQWDMSS